MTSLDSSAYVISASIIDNFRERDGYPFNLSAIRGLHNLEFHPGVTFLVGENGAGKSTLIEAIAVALGFNPEGGSRSFNFATKDTHSELHQYLKVVRGVKRPKDGFFLRAESFYNVASFVDNLYSEAERPLANKNYGDKSLHGQSHGESFISIVRHRFRSSGLYIMDEPEAALSVPRQLEFIALMHSLIGKSSQFVIATHSPVILSYPNAHIYSIGPSGVERIAYEETDQYQLMRYFINNRESVLDEILR